MSGVMASNRFEDPGAGLGVTHPAGPARDDDDTAGGRAGRCVVVLGTGGTIAGVAASATDNVGYASAQRGVIELLAAVPALARFEVEA